jgi:hypothetical protein
VPGPFTKKLTHKRERVCGQQETEEILENEVGKIMEDKDGAVIPYWDYLND